MGHSNILLDSIVGSDRAQFLRRVMTIEPPLPTDASRVSRSTLSQVLNMALFSDVLRRVPDAEAYVQDCLHAGRRVVHDHGALRTVALTGMGTLPMGEDSIVRLLTPLGYELAGIYPLEKLRMTGRAYKHIDHPYSIAQFFVSELHPERFSSQFQSAVHRVTVTSRNPLSPFAEDMLARLARDGGLSVENALALLPVLVGCFACQHDTPLLSDYEILLKESAEMAWIATEGNTFNHATDRVADVEAVAQAQKALRRPMKDDIEVSRSGRVRQTAFRAALVTRKFRTDQGGIVERDVPGSFYEFITRDVMIDSTTGNATLDLSFDSSNAQGIFKMTRS